MAMGIVSNEEFEKELARAQPAPEVKIPEILPLEHPGRKEGDNNVPDALRKIIGETNELEGREAALKLAASFGISPSSVSAYGNGSTSTASMHKRPNLSFLNRRKEIITRKATKLLAASIDKITEEKLANAKPAELASVARNMSAIVKEMEPEVVKEETKDKPQFVVFAPQIRDERSYEVTFARE